MKQLIAFIIILTIASCTKNGNTISPTNTVTVTTGAGTLAAQTYTLNSVPSTSVLASGTPFYITGEGVLPGGGLCSVVIDLNNSNCSYPNFVSGTYNLCGENPYDLPSGTNSCPTATNNHITFTSYSSNNSLTVTCGSFNGGNVVVNFNSGTASGTFSYMAYTSFSANHDLPTDSTPVTGSFSVSY